MYLKLQNLIARRCFGFLTKILTLPSRSSSWLLRSTAARYFTLVKCRYSTRHFKITCWEQLRCATFQLHFNAMETFTSSENVPLIHNIYLRSYIRLVQTNSTQTLATVQLLKPMTNMTKMFFPSKIGDTE